MRSYRKSTQGKSHSEYITGEIDKEVKSIVDNCYSQAKQIILDNKAVLERCAKLLLEKERINQEEFEKIFSVM